MTAPRPPRIRPASESISLMGLGLVPPRCCDDCGVPVNRVPEGNERDAYLAEDRVLSGAQPKRGHVTLCRTCANDPVKAAERKRRLRKVPAGNFMDSLR